MNKFINIEDTNLKYILIIRNETHFDLFYINLMSLSLTLKTQSVSISIRNLIN